LSGFRLAFRSVAVPRNARLAHASSFSSDRGLSGIRIQPVREAIVYRDEPGSHHMVKLRPAFLLGLVCVAAASQAFAQTPVAKQFSQFGGGGQGLYWVPSSGPTSHIAFLAIHRTGDYLSHVSTQELPRRGFSVLGMNSRFKNNEASVNWELIALDVRAGVRFLRAQPGITKVILIGHSGGGPTTSYYQAVAENGPSYCMGANKLSPCTASQLAGFVATDRADGIVFLDAHPGNTVNGLRSLNAAVKKEDKPDQLDKKLDPFDTNNGFNPTGDSVYSGDFVQRYTDAQAGRMNDLIDKALEMRAAAQSGNSVPTEDNAFVAYRDSARLSDFSTGVWRGTLNPAKLLKNDGTIDASQVVNTVRISNPGNKETDESFDGALFLTLTSFLSANAIRSTNSLNGIDWCSSNNSTPCAAGRISVPVLVMSMQGHYFIRDGEQIYQSSVSADRDFVVVEGATHGLGPCTPCGVAQGKSYANARTNLFNYVRDWAAAPRF
jgi:pimeloyl-ACP methyl ester carboxylesterase